MEQLALKLPSLKAELSARHPVNTREGQKNGWKDVHSLTLRTDKHVPLNGKETLQI